MMQIKTQKYKVLSALSLVLILLVFYGCNRQVYSSEELRFNTILCFLLLCSILYYLLKVYKNENTLAFSCRNAIELAKSNSTVLMNMSHEIRTPLNSVIGFSEQLGKSKLDEKQRAQLEAIQSSSLILLDLVNDILDYSKLETYKARFDKIPFSPLDAINEVLMSTAILASKKGIELKTDISFKDTLCFSGDPLRLKQVLMNLLSNAIKFTDEGSVTLKAYVMLPSEKQGLLNVQVSDTGVGISSKDLAIIFEEFAQVNNRSSPFKHKGTGLGLAITKKIIEFQGGQIEVISELGKGSTFNFSIPYERSYETFLSADLAPINPSNLSGLRILLADDNEMNILLIQTVLHNYKMVIDIADDGEKAMELFEKNHYDLVLTDIHMPKMNGLELSKAIRLHQNELKNSIPIFAVTASVLSEDRALYAKAGIDDLILKPFSEKQLISKIASRLTPL